MDELFKPITIGKLQLPNRIFMAPLTRGRAEENGTPNDLMVEYYTQRASAGLIITEATAFSPQGFGWDGAPKLYDANHVKAWQKITDSVHKNGGHIYFQMWHMGRISHPDFLNGELPVAPSAITAKGHTRTHSHKKDYVTPRALELDEIPGLIQSYVDGAKRAVAAGFDGVEIHSANGYLLDEFIRDGSNKRTDKYGGSIENRTRLSLEITEAVAKAIGADKTAIRLSPRSPNGDVVDSNPVETFTYIAEKLSDYNLSYLHVKEETPPGKPAEPRASYEMRKVYKGVFLSNGGYTKELAEKEIADGKVDAVAFGVPFIANADLVERFKENAPLNKANPKTFYSRGPEGYTDYPLLNKSAA